jgi:hypothetical protein
VCSFSQCCASVAFDLLHLSEPIFEIMILAYLKLETELRSLSPGAKLYRPSERRLSSKLVPTLRIKGVAWLA